MKLGLDIGSTTIKLVVLDTDASIRFASYQRHGGKITESMEALFQSLAKALPDLQQAEVAVSGSAGMGLSEMCDIPFVQEVHATRIGCQRFLPNADVVIELGGEDAKILFLTEPVDARMNGSCAGGTGAFIDQMATLLKISPESLNEKAQHAQQIYTIASRCGVFAKSDIQPLLNQGARIEDLCASILYSVVNQTVSGLAQGRKIAGNIVYLGGPLTFLSALRSAFDHVLKVDGTLPENSLYFVAIGTALCAQESLRIEDLQARFDKSKQLVSHVSAPALFASQAEYAAFCERHRQHTVIENHDSAYSGPAFLGIDAGSTTVKTVLLDDEGALLHSSYRANHGNPVPLLREQLLAMFERFPAMQLAAATVTGYGEQLVRDALQADYGIIETMAHLRAAQAFCPEVDFIIDIGGQDMKCFRIVDGLIGDIYLNEACSSGCGSFLQTFAEALGQDINAFSQMGILADAPVDLGSRCTVFMNSSVKQAQKDGASLENISAGLSISVVKNALYKVIRAVDPSLLGRHVVVQGGTFHNDAVLRAFERELGYDVIRPSIAGLMGAYGAALYGKAQAGKAQRSNLLSADALTTLTIQTSTAHCKLCGNQCLLTINTFSNGRKSISGNRCDKPVTGRESPAASLDLYVYKQGLLDACRPVQGARGKIGLPLVLNLYELLPFWHALFSTLGFEVVTSPHSSRRLYFLGQNTIPSDTVCYPAKLAHGHLRALCDMPDVETIFYPCMTYNFDENISDNHYNCPVVAYYPEVLDANCEELGRKNFIHGHLGLHRRKDFVRKLLAMLSQYYSDLTTNELRRAVDAAFLAYEQHLQAIRIKGDGIIRDARQQGKPIVVLAGRPYHVDGEINHGIHSLITRYGAAVISEDCIAHRLEKQPTHILNQWTYHARLFSAAHYVATQPDMQLVQLVSFGCGLDAVTTDEVREILTQSGKLYTQIKIDEIANLGAVNIRLRSLFAAVEQRQHLTHQ